MKNLKYYVAGLGMDNSHGYRPYSCWPVPSLPLFQWHWSIRHYLLIIFNASARYVLNPAYSSERKLVSGINIAVMLIRKYFTLPDYV